MSTAPTFDPYGDQKETEKRPRSWLMTCLIGCLVIVVIVLIVMAVVFYYISQNWRGWTAEGGRAVVMQMVNEADLPQQEKQEIEVQVNRLAEAIRDGKMSIEQMGTMFEKLAKSPVMTTIIVSTADAKYINNSGLSDEEKAEARITVQRFVRGAIDGKISENDANQTMDHIADRQPGGGLQFRDSVTDEQLRAFLTDAKAKADAADIPAEPEAIDPSDEVKRVIDEVMTEPAELP